MCTLKSFRMTNYKKLIRYVYSVQVSIDVNTVVMCVVCTCSFPAKLSGIMIIGFNVITFLKYDRDVIAFTSWLREFQGRKEFVIKAFCANEAHNIVVLMTFLINRVITLYFIGKSSFVKRHSVMSWKNQFSLLVYSLYETSNGHTKDMISYASHSSATWCNFFHIIGTVIVG